MREAFTTGSTEEQGVRLFVPVVAVDHAFDSVAEMENVEVD